MIIDNFHVMEMAVTPDETDSPLIVDANGVLAFPISPQGFQLVSGRRRQDAKFRSSVQLKQFAESDPLECTKALGPMIMKKRFGFLAAETLDHTSSILRVALYAK